MKKLLLATYFVATSGLFLAQETQSFSLEQAQAYALEHNYEKSNADNDLLIAKKKVWETTGIGLPQVKAEAKLQNFIDIPTSLVPANTFNPAAPADEYLALKFGTDYNNSVGVTATQLLFDGSYLVGLRASKVYKEFAEKNVAKTEIEVKNKLLRLITWLWWLRKTNASWKNRQRPRKTCSIKVQRFLRKVSWKNKMWISSS